MKSFLIALVATLFSTLAYAVPKDDLMAALAACTGAPDSVQRHQCTQNAFAAFYVTVGPLKSPKKAAKTTTTTRSAVTGQYVPAAEAKKNPATTVTEAVKK